MGKFILISNATDTYSSIYTDLLPLWIVLVLAVAPFIYLSTLFFVALVIEVLKILVRKILITLVKILQYQYFPKSPIATCASEWAGVSFHHII